MDRGFFEQQTNALRHAYAAGIGCEVDAFCFGGLDYRGPACRRPVGVYRLCGHVRDRHGRERGS